MGNFSFRESAKRATEISELMNGREKITTKEIIETYPDGVTIVAVDMVTTDEATYPVLLFKEDDSKFYTGGLVLKKIVAEWLENFDMDSDKCSDALAKDGGVMVKLELAETKKKQNLTKVTIL